MEWLIFWSILDTIIFVILMLIWIWRSAEHSSSEKVRRRENEKDANAAGEIIERDENIENSAPESRPFCLYLRPFSVDDTIHMLHPNAVKRINSKRIKADFVRHWWHWVVPFDVSALSMIDSTPSFPELPFETSLKRACKEQGLLMIGLGLPDKFEGLSHVRVADDAWKRKLIKLLVEARVVACIPSCSKGTLWEINELLKRRYIKKTVFIWPAGSFVNRPDERTTPGARRQWRKECQERFDSIWAAIAELAPPAADPVRSFHFTYKYSEGRAESRLVLDQTAYWPEEFSSDLEGETGEAITRSIADTLYRLQSNHASLEKGAI